MATEAAPAISTPPEPPGCASASKRFARSSGLRPRRASAGRRNGWPGSCGKRAPGTCESRRSPRRTGPSGGRSACLPAPAPSQVSPRAGEVGCAVRWRLPRRLPRGAGRRRAATREPAVPAAAAQQHAPSRARRDRSGRRRADDCPDGPPRRAPYGLLLQPGDHRDGRGERPLGLREHRHQPAADVAGGRRPGAGRRRRRSRQPRADRLGNLSRRAAPHSWPTSARGDVVPAANDNGTGCVARSPSRGCSRSALSRTRGSSSSPPRKRPSARGWACSWSAMRTSCRATDLLPLPRDARLAEPARPARRGHAGDARVPGRGAGAGRLDGR